MNRSAPWVAAPARRIHLTVCTLEVRMRPSRLMAGTPKYTAVAATMRSGMSGMSTRDTFSMASMISEVTGAPLKNVIGVVQRFLQIGKR